MKKWILFLALILVLAACSSGNNDDANEQEGNVEPEETKEIAEEEVTNEEKESESESETDEQTNGGEVGTQSTEKKPAEKEKKASTQVDNKESERPKVDEHQDVVDLAYDIFDAQHKKDYAFLESVASKGTKVDRKQNKFIFENVTYPFEMEFFTKEDLGNLEFRYTHEDDDGTVFVGFGAIHSGDQSSFVIDFEFIEENGTWKMKSMDINK